MLKYKDGYTRVDDYKCIKSLRKTVGLLDFFNFFRIADGTAESLLSGEICRCACKSRLL
jgi:hypothetical protein